MDRQTEKSWITSKVKTTREANRLQNTMHLIMFDWALWRFYMACVWGLYQFKVFLCWATEITAVCQTVNGCTFYRHESTSVGKPAFLSFSLLFPPSFSLSGVWPSEEVMAHYCLQNRHKFKWVFLSLKGCTHHKISFKKVSFVAAITVTRFLFHPLISIRFNYLKCLTVSVFWYRSQWCLAPV